MNEFKKDSKDGVIKPLMSEINYHLLLDVGLVLEQGRIKYGHSNWKSAKQEELFHYESALMRHAAKRHTEGRIDKDSGLPHLAHLVCNAMFLDYFERENDMVIVPGMDWWQND